MDLSIGELARRSGVKVPTIRFYEQIGLLPPAARSDGNQRRYGAAAVERLAFIRHARQLGFEVEAIRELLRLAQHPGAPCHDADALAARHLEAVEARIERLTRLRDELRRMVEACRGGTAAECRVLQVVGDHALCAVHGDVSPSPLAGEGPSVARG